MYEARRLRNSRKQIAPFAGRAIGRVDMMDVALPAASRDVAAKPCERYNYLAHANYTAFGAAIYLNHDLASCETKRLIKTHRVGK